MAENEINFTKAALESLSVPPQGERVTYNDTKATGLQLRVSGSGVKTFSLYRWVKGEAKPERVTLGRFPDMSIDQARNKTAELNAFIAAGGSPSNKINAHKAELTLGAFFDIYMERHAKPHKRTWDEDVSKFNQYLSNNKDGLNLAPKKLSMVSRSDMAQLHAKIGKQHPVTANRVLALVSSIFGRAIDWGIWDQINPALGIKRFKETSRDRFLQADELPKFFSALAEEPNETVRDFILLSLLTGARRDNVLSMHWDQVCLERAEWRIPRTKNGEPQVVTLSGVALEILQNRQGQSAQGWVFKGKGQTGHLAEPRKGWNRVLANAGLSNLRLHDLRRTLGSWQAKTGASLAIIGKSLNHKSHNSTLIYARLDTDPIRASVDKATDAMLAAASLQHTKDSE